METKDTIIRRGENSSIDFLIAFILSMIALVLRVINYTDTSVYPDEINFFSPYAYSILTNSWSWITESRFMIQPPLFSYILAVVGYLFNGELNTFRIVSIIFGSLSIGVTYFLGKLLFNRGVGILSALLLCFNSYHILYSKLALLEATVIFFILVSIYYFVKAYNSGNNNKYAYICGIFLGLANITKFNGIFLYPLFIFFILWDKKSIKALIEKKFLIINIVSALIQLPIWIGLYEAGVNPYYYHLYGKAATANRTFSYFQTSLGIPDLLSKGFNSYLNTVMGVYKSSTAALSLPWYSIFSIFSAILLIITILYYLHAVIKKKQSETLIFFYFIIFNIYPVFSKTKFDYYLLWSLPGFYIMLSSMSFKLFDDFKSQRKNVFSSLNFVRLLNLICLSIFVFSIILVGSISPFVDKGEVSGYEENILYIKNIANPGDAIATSFYRGTAYYLDKNNMNLDIFSLYYIKGVDLKMLNEVKPRFILVLDDYYYSFLTNDYAKIWINKNYKLISKKEKTLLFEREQINSSGNQGESSENGTTKGVIDHDIFYRSIPAYMTIGKTYNVLVFVKNEGESPNTFVITLDVPDEFVYSSQKNWKLIQLNEGESYRAKFTILPIKQHVGELNITARFSIIKSKRIVPSSYEEMDNVSKHVVWIKSVFL
jgi:4-amino-4-deoxy-L-arabinose transferase-like glycosyltransferase